LASLAVFYYALRYLCTKLSTEFVYSLRKGLSGLVFSRIGAFVAEFSTVQIAVDIPVRELFSYQSAQPLTLGQRVQVPFGSRTVCGIVANPQAEPDGYSKKLKSVIQVFDELPPLPEDFLALVRFAASYYHHPYGQALFTALPTSLREPRTVHLADDRRWRLTVAGRSAVVPAHHKVRVALYQALFQSVSLDTSALRAISAQSAKVDGNAGRRRTGLSYLGVAWRDGEWQDRSLSAIDRPPIVPWTPGAGAGAGNQSDAATDLAFFPALSRDANGPVA